MLINSNAMQLVAAFAAQDDGVTAVEYGLLAALIAVVAIVAMTLTGGRLGDMYEYWTSEVARAIGNATS
jgi:pilus assembly protein Flp/PilA